MVEDELPLLEDEYAGKKVNIKKIELKIDYKRGEYITFQSFIKDMGIAELIEDSNDKFFKYRLFNEIIKVLLKLGAVKEAGKEEIKIADKNAPHRRGRKAIVYKVIKDIKMVWVIES